MSLSLWTRSSPRAGPSSIAAAKYPDTSGTSLSESVLIRFDEKGGVKEKIFLGNGLPEYSQGFVQTGADAFTVYGSDGFNPWLEAVN